MQLCGSCFTAQRECHLLLHSQSSHVSRRLFSITSLLYCKCIVSGLQLAVHPSLARQLFRVYVSRWPSLAQVSAVQREFVEKLLAKPVFQRHMTAVREVLNMLRAAQKLRSSGEPYDDQAIKVRDLYATMGLSDAWHSCQSLKSMGRGP